jgi:hypothetical protein
MAAYSQRKHTSSAKAITGMNLVKYFSIAVAIFLFVLSGGAVGLADDSQSSAANPGYLSEQPGASNPDATLNAQPGGGGHSLEIAPQNGAGPGNKDTQEIPADRTYQPSDKTASTEKNYRPDDSNGDERKPHKRPTLGISVQYQTKCYLGQEEHGLEVFTVDPDSPAAKAGLQGRTGATPAGAAAATAGALAGPISMLVMPLLKKAGSLGRDGDLIVAVDDHRVRSELDLEDELDRLKPGDTMWVTVIRPLPGGNHKTMKIGVKVGQPGEQPTEQAADDPGAEQYAY